MTQIPLEIAIIFVASAGSILQTPGVELSKVTGSKESLTALAENDVADTAFVPGFGNVITCGLVEITKFAV